MLKRCDSINLGFLTISCKATTAGLNLSRCPTCIIRPFDSAIPISSSASSRVVVIGFSIRTSMPFSRKFLLTAKWTGVGTTAHSIDFSEQIFVVCICGYA